MPYLDEFGNDTRSTAAVRFRNVSTSQSLLAEVARLGEDIKMQVVFAPLLSRDIHSRAIRASEPGSYKCLT